MAEALDLGRLRLERNLRRLSFLVFVEAMVIVGLLGALSMEYAANPSMQEWIRLNVWPAAFLLNGTLAGVLTGLLAGWVLASVLLRRSKEQAVLDRLRKVV